MPAPALVCGWPHIRILHTLAGIHKRGKLVPLCVVIIGPQFVYMMSQTYIEISVVHRLKLNHKHEFKTNLWIPAIMILAPALI